jgi:hypothetical protein
LHKIDYKIVAGLSVEEAMALLNGPARSSVVLGIIKPKHRLRVNVRLQREQVRPGPADNIIAQAADTGPNVIRNPVAGKPIWPFSQRAHRVSIQRVRGAAANGQRARSTMQFTTPICEASDYLRPATALTPFWVSPYNSVSMMQYRL